MFDGRCGVVVGILAYYGFDPRTVQTFVCMNMSDCIGSGCYLCIILMYLQKKVHKYVYLSVI
jgi:phage shock protein PspC (stress-responsive transcriptional regulator)